MTIRRLKNIKISSVVSVWDTVTAALLGLVLILQMGHVAAQLSPDYYTTTCPDLQAIVSSAFEQLARSNNVVSPSTLRMLVHDCFIQGCDGSILITSTPTNIAERDYIDNDIPQQAFDTINTIKAAIEVACPGVVSCADIVVLAAREAVRFLGGPTWDVSFGRRDSRVSLASNSEGNIPSSTMDADQLIEFFQSKGLDVLDLVALSGAHTVGFSRCRQFRFRLTDGDPFIHDFSFARQLQQQCPQSNSATFVPLDPDTPFDFDTSYFRALQNNRGLLFTDQVLFANNATRGLVNNFATDQALFFQAFGNSMIKMSSIGVLTGNDGEIRQDCTRINPM